jgi:hypothetical protein
LLASLAVSPLSKRTPAGHPPVPDPVEDLEREVDLFALGVEELTQLVAFLVREGGWCEASEAGRQECAREKPHAEVAGQLIDPLGQVRRHDAAPPAAERQEPPRVDSTAPLHLSPRSAWAAVVATGRRGRRVEIDVAERHRQRRAGAMLAMTLDQVRADPRAAARFRPRCGYTARAKSCAA